MSADPERVADFMRALYPQKTAELVAADTGMTVAAARKVLTRGGGLSFANFIRMISAYGPAFLCAVMPRVPDWLDEAAARAEQARLEAHLAEVTRRIEAAR